MQEEVRSGGTKPRGFANDRGAALRGELGKKISDAIVAILLHTPREKDAAKEVRGVVWEVFVAGT
jgi:hypothetical protein